nr:hypothetical protein [Rickettsiaceae bacterium]
MPTEEEEKSKRKTGSKWNKVRELFRGVSLKGDDPADCVRVKMIHDAYLEEVARSIQTDEDGQEYKMLRMTPEQLESHKLINKNGVLHFRINSSTLGDVYKIASTIGGEGSGERDHQSFIIAKNGAFYVANHRGQYFTDRKNFTHVSFLGGRPAELAGTIAINNQGKITEITNNSSHYQPDKLDMYRGIRRLQREMPGVFGDRCIVRLLGVSSKRIVDFISEMEAIDPKTQKPLHEILRQKRVDDRQKEVAYLKSDFPERDYFEKIIDSFNISRGQRLDPRLFLYQDPQSSIRTKLEAIMKSRKELRNPSAPMQLLIDKLKENNKLEEFLEMRISGYPNPMLFALDKGYLEALDVMLKNGVDVDCKIDGTPMIYYALDSKASLDFMVSKGADINALDKSGDTLMH